MQVEGVKVFKICATSRLRSHSDHVTFEPKLFIDSMLLLMMRIGTPTSRQNWGRNWSG